MKKISLLLAIVLSLVLILSGCGAANGKAEMDMAFPNSAPAASAEPEKPMEDYYYAGGVKGEYDAVDGGANIYNNTNNKIIRTASLSIQTTEFDESVAALNRLTNELGGYFETADVQSGGYYNSYASRSAYYIVRIPKENFVAFRDGTSGIGHVNNISENAQDVGETYYDTEARLKTLTTKRDRLLDLLEKAEYMEDIITLENALADVQYQIDMHTATLRKYDSLIGYSTFNIRLNEVEKISEQPSVKESFGSKFVSSLKKGFESFGRNLQNFAIWFARNLIGIVIFAAIVVVVVVFFRKKIHRRRAQKNKTEE